VRDADEARCDLACGLAGALPLPLRCEVLLLTGALLAELTHDFLPKPRGLGKNVVEPIEHLFEGLGSNRRPVVCHLWA